MDKLTLENYLSQGLSLNFIAKTEGVSLSKVIYWMKKYELKANFGSFRFGDMSGNKGHRTSSIWKISDKEFEVLIKDSSRMKDVLSHFGLDNKGGNHKTVKRRAEELGLDYSHFLNKNESSNFSRKVPVEEFLELYMVENSTKARKDIKNFILKNKLISHECETCKNKGFWNEKSLTLHLEHKNGKPDDNRLENLCFLCPNCHSQTATYAGRSNRKPVIDTVKQKEPRSRKIDWPDKETLEKAVWNIPTSKLAEIYGVSDSAIGKWCKHYGISKPPRGYWTNKINSGEKT